MPSTSRLAHAAQVVFAAVLAVCAAAYSTSALSQNHAPIANPGGPYVGTAGSTIILDGSLSFDPDGNSLNFAWDLNNDGYFFDSTLLRPEYSIAADAGLDLQYLVALQVTDTSGLRSLAVTTITVVSSVPEPATFALFGIGLMCLGARFHQRKPSNAASRNRSRQNMSLGSGEVALENPLN
jgi:hypothetical protein